MPVPKIRNHGNRISTDTPSQASLNIATTHHTNLASQTDPARNRQHLAAVSWKPNATQKEITTFEAHKEEIRYLRWRRRITGVKGSNGRAGDGERRNAKMGMTAREWEGRIKSGDYGFPHWLQVLACSHVAPIPAASCLPPIASLRYLPSPSGVSLPSPCDQRSALHFFWHQIGNPLRSIALPTCTACPTETTWV